MSCPSHQVQVSLFHPRQITLHILKVSKSIWTGEGCREYAARTLADSSPKKFVFRGDAIHPLLPPPTPRAGHKLVTLGNQCTYVQTGRPSVSIFPKIQVVAAFFHPSINGVPCSLQSSDQCDIYEAHALRRRRGHCRVNWGPVSTLRLLKSTTKQQSVVPELS